MKKVTVLRLSGCSYCEELIEAFDREGIVYDSIDANENEKLADDVEDFIGVNTYPIVLMSSSKKGLPSFYFYRADSLELAGEKTKDGAVLVGHYDLNSMINNIVNIVK
jgi:glutaredoxin